MASKYFQFAARKSLFSFGPPHMGLKSALRLSLSATSAGAVTSCVRNIISWSVGSLLPLHTSARTAKSTWSLSLASRCCMPLSHGFVNKSNEASDEVSSHLHGKTDLRMMHHSQIIHVQMLHVYEPVIGRIFRFQTKAFSSSARSIQRNSSFSILNSDDVFHFKEILGDKNVVQDEDRLLSANVDWMRKYKGSSQLLLLPRTTEEVSHILRYCNSRHLAVVPQGGNTGLVGGSVPVFDEVIVNVSSLNKIISFDKVSGILVCEAGCILENLNTFLANEGFMMPLDLGAKGSCQIGGNISSNAGGLRFIRYGSLHGNVLGLEVVLADGTILDMLKTLRKDNTGFDLKHLFIGSEGSLGIVTKVAILTPPRLASTNVAFLACKDYVSCKKLLTEAKRTLGEVLSAFEFLDRYSMDMVLTHLEGVRHPLPASIHDFYVIIETTSSDESFDKSRLETFLEQSCERDLITDGVVAQDTNQASSFWRIREGITEALTKAGAVYKYDLSLPVEYLYSIVEEMRSRLEKSAKVLGYGHLGDGNLHLNISTSTYDENILLKIEPFVYEWTSKYHGSISAEHGIGHMKADKIHYSKSPETVHLMAALKRLIDPNGILNPYKVLPASHLSPTSRG